MTAAEADRGRRDRHSTRRRYTAHRRRDRTGRGGRVAHAAAGQRIGAADADRNQALTRAAQAVQAAAASTIANPPDTAPPARRPLRSAPMRTRCWPTSGPRQPAPATSCRSPTRGRPPRRSPGCLAILPILQVSSSSSCALRAPTLRRTRREPDLIMPSGPDGPSYPKRCRAFWAARRSRGSCVPGMRLAPAGRSASRK